MSFRSKKSFINNNRIKDKNLDTRNSNHKMNLELANTAKIDVMLQRDHQNLITDHDLDGSSIKHINYKPR